MSNNRIRKVGIIAKSNIGEREDYVRQLIEELKKRKIEIMYDKNVAPLVSKNIGSTKSTLLARNDMVIVLGGDGTLLKTARNAPQKCALIAAVNMGTLGFLTEFAPKDLLKKLGPVLKGNFFTDERMLLRVTTYRNGKKFHTTLSLNDAVINQGGFARLITLKVEINQRLLGNFHADGLILSSATGSTGHALSAGGPIVHPRLDSFILTPICPAKLSMRPIVIPSDRQVSVKVETEWRRERKPIVLTIDGQITLNLRRDDVVRVRRSSRSIHMIRMNEHNYYPVLRRKLNWGE